MTKWENASFANHIDKLPILTFAFGERATDVIQIPLASLVERLGNGSYFFHLYNRGEIITIPRYGVIRPMPVLELGTRILHRYMAIFDVDNLRVGFVAKQKLAQSDMICKVKPKCKGAQTYYAPMNECVDPECYLYLFQSVDDNSKTCRMVYLFCIFTPILARRVLCLFWRYCNYACRV